jgi:hypothetical protein
MLIPNHPDSERLSALASGDPDATGDASLTDHVAGCRRCTDLVTELGALRASLAELPDLRPHRPLRLLPEVAPEPARVDRLGGWAKRFFAPVLTAGAALALVGAVGTVGPSFAGMAGSAGSSVPADVQTLQSQESDPGVQPGAPEPSSADNAEGAAGGGPAASEGSTRGGVTVEAPQPSTGYETLTSDVPRSPWPMVLWAGVALIIAASVLRWILAPRAG